MTGCPPSPSRPTTRFFFQLNTCGYSPYVTSSLRRAWVCRSQLLLAVASAVILGFKSRQILLSQIRDPPNLEDEVPVVMSARIRVAQLHPPGTGFHFRGLLRLAAPSVSY
jgi:hypothetical protein